MRLPKTLSYIKCDKVPSRVLSYWTKQGYNFLHAGASAHTAGALFMFSPMPLILLCPQMGTKNTFCQKRLYLGLIQLFFLDKTKQKMEPSAIGNRRWFILKKVAAKCPWIFPRLGQWFFTCRVGQYHMN